jgi:methionyl-tRNA synthetase
MTDLSGQLTQIISEAVKAYWSKLVSRGVIKEGKHTGYYSVNEESFIAEKDLIHKE